MSSVAMPPPTVFEKTLSAAIDPIFAAGKTGYAWSTVDALLIEELKLATTRVKKATESGRAANVLVESNDKDIDLYLILIGPGYSLASFRNVARTRMDRFENVKAVAVADRTSGEWRVREFYEHAGLGLGPKMKAVFPCIEKIETINTSFSGHATSAVDDSIRDADWLARRYAEWLEESGYPTEEDEEHLKYRETFAAALSEAHLAAEDLDTDLFKKLCVKWFGGPGSQSHLMRFLQENPDTGSERLAATIYFLLYGTVPVAERITAVLEDPKYKISGFGESMATKCLAVVYPEKWLPLFVYESTGGSGKADFLRLLDVPFDADGKTIGESVEQSNDLLRELTEPLQPGEPWAQSSFLWWLKSRGVSSQGLADELLIDQWWIDEIQQLIADKSQIIFYGPPGTGKTYVAKRIAETMAGKGNMRIIQFHPSYAYEDFVQGYRPLEDSGNGGNVSFALQDGPLMELAKKAADNGEQCVVLIDEINRANISKVFGELYFLLEYRGERIRLQYGDDFSLPDNLAFIGTMNTADRSIALMDAALRRRFNFVPFFPDEQPIKGLLGRWLERNRPEMLFVADVVDEANLELGDRNLQIGPSYFMRESLDQVSLERIWRFSIIPYIEEHFFDDPDRVEDFALAKLTARVNAKQGKMSSAPEVTPGEEAEGDGDASGDETTAG